MVPILAYKQAQKKMEMRCYQLWTIGNKLARQEKVQIQNWSSICILPFWRRKCSFSTHFILGNSDKILKILFKKVVHQNNWFRTKRGWEF